MLLICERFKKLKALSVQIIGLAFNSYCMLINLSWMFLFYSISCNGQVKTNQSSDSLQKSKPFIDQGLGLPKTAAEMQASLDEGKDPYFVESKDTFSVYAPQCIVRDLIQDKKGNIWLATWQGIIKYDGKIFTNYTLKEGLIHFHVGSLFEDSKGCIWFGTTRGGVYRYDGNSESTALTNYNNPKVTSSVFTLFTTRDGLADNTVYCIAEDKNGNIWLGTENGASRYEARLHDEVGQGKTFTNFTTKDGLCHNYINAIIRDKTGNMWLGTNNGISCYNGTSFNQFTYDKDKSFKKVASLFQDHDGNIWIGSESKQAGGKGLCRYNGKTVTEFITPNFVMYMCQDKKGNLWFAHNQGAENINFALYRYNACLHNEVGQRKTLTKITEQSKPDNPVIFGIIEDKSGNIWFGTAKGVYRYDGKKITSFTD